MRSIYIFRCADYVKHLVKTTEEKEEAVEKAKSDLEVKERKLEEDKALLEGRSDPESVTSTLTASSAGSRGDGGATSGNAKPVAYPMIRVASTSVRQKMWKPLPI